MEQPQRGEVTTELVWAAASFSVDAQTATITQEFNDAGIRSILLKGPAIAEWLYQGRAVRAYADTDLLISPDDWDKAASVLRGLGFKDGLESLGHPRMESVTSYPWARGNDDVDLHCVLWGIKADPDQTWAVLSTRTVPMRVGGREVEVLAPEPRALHVALHAAQHGPTARKPMADLELALSLLPIEVWREAARLAAELGATDAFATALTFSPEGTALAERLGVADKRSVEALLRASQVPLSEGFEQLATTPGLSAKLALVRSELFPTSQFMRWWSPLARRGRRGMVVTYLWRPLWFLWRAVPAFLAWRRAHKDAASASDAA